MAASVRIEDEAFADERYEDLALFAGLADADHARGKMVRIWRQCTLEQTHRLETHVALRILGPNAIEALIKSRLGEKDGDYHIRIRGTVGRIEWLKRLRDNGKHGSKGGRPKGQSDKPDNNPSGLPNKTHQGVVDQTPPAPAPAPAPALINKRGRTPLAPRVVDPSYQAAIDAFDGRFREAYGSPPTWGAKQGAQVNRLLKSHGLGEFIKRVRILFDSPPPWLSPPFDLGTLERHFDKLATSSAGAKVNSSSQRVLQEL